VKIIYIVLSVLCLFGLSACSETKVESAAVTAITIERSDECHLCGMIIEGFPGPKGGVTHKTDNIARKFCSTRDMFAYYLDPEHKRNVKQLLVHDMSQVPWETPSDDLFIDARSAWYVSGSSKSGAMGTTLASFAKQSDAFAFSSEFGGEVLNFEQVTPQIINGF